MDHEGDMVMRWAMMVAGMMVLAACTNVVNSSDKATHIARKTAYDTTTKIQSWTRYNPPTTTPQAAQSGYCYKVISDVVCYDRPQPHITSKLVAAQGDAFAPLPQDEIMSESAAPIPQVASFQTPFYVKQAPYIQSGGVEVSSSKILTQSGASGSRVQSASGSTRDNFIVKSANPQALLPRF